MNNKIKKEKGVSLVSLSIAIIVLVIITNMILYNVKENLVTEKLKNMQNDIENLVDKVSVYYAEYGKIPASKKYTNIQHIKNAGVISDVVDTGDFFVIDLSVIDNLTLNYGEDFKNINSSLTEEQINEYTDVYIINEDSHNIFYVEGIKIENDIFYTTYTKNDIDKKAVDIRYINNIKIPEGYKYKEGNLNTEIRIISINNDNNEYKWVKTKEEVTIIPNGAMVDNEEEFLKSVNLYKGYYENIIDNTDIFCIELSEKWSPVYDVEGIYKDKNGDTAVIPAGFQVSGKLEETKINEGLVIKNGQTEDRYVWIEVPKEIYITATTETEYSNIEKDLQTYVSIYRTSDSDTWYDGCGLTEIEYNSLKNAMLSSIYVNGGFWISQYEIGADTYVTVSDNGARNPVSKEGAYVYNLVSCARAQELADSMDSGNKTSSLLFGIQWDLTLKFLEENGNKTSSQILRDSTDWGNFRNAQFVITKGKFSIDYGRTYMNVDETEEKQHTKYEFDRTLLSTGVTIRNSCLNIYDLAGNIEELTLERSLDSDNPCIYRGGVYGNEGYTQTVSTRGKGTALYSETITSVGFRVALY